LEEVHAQARAFRIDGRKRSRHKPPPEPCGNHGAGTSREPLYALEQWGLKAETILKSSAASSREPRSSLATKSAGEDVSARTLLTEVLVKVELAPLQEQRHGEGARSALPRAALGSSLTASTHPFQTDPR